MIPPIALLLAPTPATNATSAPLPAAGEGVGLFEQLVEQIGAPTVTEAAPPEALPALDLEEDPIEIDDLLVAEQLLQTPESLAPQLEKMAVPLLAQPLVCAPLVAEPLVSEPVEIEQAVDVTAPAEAAKPVEAKVEASLPQDEAPAPLPFELQTAELSPLEKTDEVPEALELLDVSAPRAVSLSRHAVPAQTVETVPAPQPTQDEHSANFATMLPEAEVKSEPRDAAPVAQLNRPEAPQEPRSPLVRNALERLEDIEHEEGRTRVLLRPQGLGILEIDVIRQPDGRLHMAIRAENPLILHSLQQEAGALSAFLGARGFDMAGGGPDLGRYTRPEPSDTEAQLGDEASLLDDSAADLAPSRAQQLRAGELNIII